MIADRAVKATFFRLLTGRHGSGKSIKSVQSSVAISYLSIIELACTWMVMLSIQYSPKQETQYIGQFCCNKHASTFHSKVCG